MVTRRGVRGGYLLLGALFALLASVALLVQPYLPGEQEPAPPTLSVHSSRGGGTRALSLWLADLGYRPTNLEYRPFAVDPEVRLLFVLAPTVDPTEAQVSQIVGWLEQGGTLVLVADEQNRLLDRLGVGIRTRSVRLAQAVPRQPALQDPPLGLVEVETRTTLRLLRPEWVPLLGSPDSDGDPVVAISRLGRGRAFVLSSRRPLSNDALGHADNGALALNFLAAVPPGSVVAFDEYHHGLTEHGTLGARLVSEPWGWAVLYSGVLLFAYVALRGRRFGRALPPSRDRPKRSRAEYVVTLAALLRQGKHRGWLCQQYTGQVKRALASRYRVRADLPAGEFVAALAAQRPEAAALAAPLIRLEQAQPASDAAAVALVREVDAVEARLLK